MSLAVASRSLFRQSLFRSVFVCPSCQLVRTFASSRNLRSGHNKWSTIKHDKSKNDATKNKQRSQLAREIELSAKLHGANPSQNPNLATRIAAAKKAGLPKNVIDAALLRAQGLSSSGSKLENLTIEAVLPSSIGTIVECMSDNKARTLQDVRAIIRDAKGTPTPSAFLFEKHGRIVFEATKEDADEDEILEALMDVEGITDVDSLEERQMEVSTEVSDINTVTERIENLGSLKAVSSEITWSPIPVQMTSLPDDEAKAQGVLDWLCTFADKVSAVPGVERVFMNVAKGGPMEAFERLKARVSLGASADSSPVQNQ